jgi:hypothetical protein
MAVDDPAPEGFWEPEVPYEDRSTQSDHSLSESGMTGVEDADARGAGPATIVIDLVEPGSVRLELTQTSVPIFQFGRTGTRTRMESHTFVIVTTVPRSEYVPRRTAVGETSYPLDPAFAAIPPTGLAPLPRTTILPSPASPPKQPSTLPTAAQGAAQITPTDEIMALDLSASGEGASRPLVFNRDGTISRSQGRDMSGMDPTGRPLDVQVLLNTFAWEKTALGPKDQWPQSLKTVGESAHTTELKQSHSSCNIRTSVVCGGARI